MSSNVPTGFFDLGPEGGEQGGFLLAEGRPEDVAKVKTSYTGQFLRTTLGNKRKPPLQIREGARVRAKAMNKV